MMFRSGHYLGLVVRMRSMLLAELQVAGDRRCVERMEEFTYPADLSLEQPAALGKALRQFLRQHHFAIGHCAVGLPARWLMAAVREVPPTTPDLAASALRLQAEHDHPTDLKEMIFDYAGRPNSTAASQVLLVTMPHDRLDSIQQLAEAAGLSLVAVTSTMMALAQLAQGASDGQAHLLLSPGAAELAICGDGAVRLLRHIPLPADGDVAGDLGCELYRILLGLPFSARSSPLPKLLLWDDGIFDGVSSDNLANRLAMPVQRMENLALLGVETSIKSTPATRFAPAAALALVAGRHGGAGIDFLHSRLAPPRSKRLGRRTAWAAALVLAILTGVGVLLYGNHVRQRELDSLNDQLQRMETDAHAAEVLASRLRVARGWYDNRPPVLVCINELNIAIPDDGQVWTTNLMLRENRKGVLNGKSNDQRNVLSLLDRIKSNHKFSDVKLMDMREAGGAAREVAFSLSFTFNGVE